MDDIAIEHGEHLREEIREMLDEAYESAREILTRYMPQLHIVAAALMEREKLTGEQFMTLMNGGTLDGDGKKAGDGPDAHVEKAVDVAHLRPGPLRVEPGTVAGDRELLVQCGHFAVERLRVTAEDGCELAGGLILIVLDGTGFLDGAGFKAGDAWLIPAGMVSRLRAGTSCTLLGARFRLSL